MELRPLERAGAGAVRAAFGVRRGLGPRGGRGGWRGKRHRGGAGFYGRVSNPPLLDLLSGLVDKSLVVAEADGDGALRYRLLETVRQYATEKLGAPEEEDSVRQRHAMFFLEWPSGTSPS